MSLLSSPLPVATSSASWSNGPESRMMGGESFSLPGWPEGGRTMQAAMSCSGRTRLLRLIAACDRLKRHLGDLAAETIATWQPPADALASKLRIERSGVAILGEEVCSLDFMSCRAFSIHTVLCPLRN